MTDRELIQDDLVYCHRTLPRVSRTFAINIRVLGRRMRTPVLLAYLLCRIADALEDSWPGTPAEVGARFDRLLTALDGDEDAAAALARAAEALPDPADDLALVAGLPRVLRVLGTRPEGERLSVLTGVHTLATGMRHYAVRAAGRPSDVPYLDDEAELGDYCYVVAGCVGEMLTALFEQGVPAPDPPRAARRVLAPVVGEALQLTNILLDWPRDVRRGRCYVPATWLAEHGLTVRDLVDRDGAGVRAISTRLESRARAALARVPDYLECIPARHVRFRLFCLWPALWAGASLSRAHEDPRFPWGDARPRLPKTRLWGAALTSLLLAHDHRQVRRMLATA